MAYKQYDTVLSTDLYDGQAGFRFVMMLIAYLIPEEGDQRGWLRVKESYLSRRAGISVRTVERAIAQMEADGVLTVKKRRGQNWYKLNMNVVESRLRPPNIPEADLTAEELEALE